MTNSSLPQNGLENWELDMILWIGRGAVLAFQAITVGKSGTGAGVAEARAEGTGLASRRWALEQAIDESLLDQYSNCHGHRNGTLSYTTSAMAGKSYLIPALSAATD